MIQASSLTTPGIQANFCLLRGAPDNPGFLLVSGNNSFGEGLYIFHDSLISSMGTLNINGKVTIQGTDNSVLLDGEAGDISLSNADVAEEFDTSDALLLLEPGSVVVLTESGAVGLSNRAYDPRVLRPGITLDRRTTTVPRVAVSCMGKVFCKVDAQYGSIEVGDLLTSSATPGHAMKVQDRSEALGTTVGKALAPLQSGTGLIPVLVALQ